tara:strand:- start:192 stop:959 length:768 start_codon:yes stop_codon:yes gene_type:complete
MIQYQLKTTNGITTQSFFEVCEHCQERVRELDVVEVVVKKKTDPRILRIKKSKNPAEEIVLKTMKDKLIEITESFIRKGLLDEDEAREAFLKPKPGLKYGIRSEAMCSESIDIIDNVTQSFCYKVVDNAKFNAKEVNGVSISASFAAADKANVTGSKMGVDRKGNVIFTKKYKLVNLDTGIAESELPLEKQKGAYKASWWPNVAEERQKDYIRQMTTCEAFQARYGEVSSKDLSVVARFRNEVELRAALIDSRCE